MNFFRRLGKVVPILSILALLSIHMAPLQAAMVDNETLLAQSQHELTVQQVLNTLDRQDIQDRLVAMGVDPADAKSRISQMNNAELAQIAENFEQMPAGSGAGSILGVLLVIFIVLVVTDMLGATDVFAFVHNINR
ncbi:DUF6627 family protein [Methylophaga sp. OBS4]|uniref:DUF6627 family protein n=1 Tax=Methylophaga sp. OBS4 TaxID=2991935 RepID=UPI0022536ED6|nr:DUF6627 family protein [Methylophaga sp. OBS4]MCX4186350.1 PA2779 family protein [Methylophaga sp. OBS4]